LGLGREHLKNNTGTAAVLRQLRRNDMTRIKNTIIVDGKRMTCRIFDTGPDGPADRYTIAFKGYRFLSSYEMVYPYLAAGVRPFHPQGFGQHGENPEFLTGRHLGKRVSFDSLPADVRQFILQNI
jgi:hypothetical protein